MSLSIWGKIVEKAFPGNARIQAGRPKCIIKTTTGAPASAAPVGTLLWNSYDLNAYICTVAAGTWAKINA